MKADNGGLQGLFCQRNEDGQGMEGKRGKYDFERERTGHLVWESIMWRLEKFVLDDIRRRSHQPYYCWVVDQNEEVKNICQGYGIKFEGLVLE